MYGNPYAPQQSPYGSPSNYAASPQSSFNTPQLHQNNQQQWYSPQPPTPAGRQTSPQAARPQSQQMPSSQMMPPPPRPNKDDRDERMNIEDINDPMYGSGVNLKDEENYMHSFQSNQTSSFGSVTMSANNSFNQLTQSFNYDGQRGPGGAFAGTMGGSQSQEDVENALKRKRADAARARAENNQHPMSNQFLQTNALRLRMDARCRAEGVLMDVRGLYQRLPPPPQQQQPEPQPQYRTNVMMNANGKEGIVSALDTRPEFTAGRGEPFEQVASLLCIAAGERLRGLMDEAFALARARRFGDHGRVPPEFADIAVGDGERRDEEVRPESITGSQWDKIPDIASSPAVNGDPPNGTAKPSTPQPQPTISFSNPITARLRSLAKRDKAAEDDRARKREARRKQAAENASSDDAAAVGETPAPEEAVAAPAMKITKKEQERQKKEANKLAEANVHSTTNQTAAMMALGGGKKGLKKYSWMTGGSTNMPTNRFARPGQSGTASPAPAVVKAEGGSPGGGGGGIGGGVGGGSGVAMARGASQQQEVRLPEWGDWREDGPGGRGIQARDWVLVLDRDGKEKRALQRVLNKLSYCLLYTSPSPRDGLLSRMPSSA